MVWWLLASKALSSGPTDGNQQQSSDPSAVLQALSGGVQKTQQPNLMQGYKQRMVDILDRDPVNGVKLFNTSSPVSGSSLDPFLVKLLASRSQKEIQ